MERTRSDSLNKLKFSWDDCTRSVQNHGRAQVVLVFDNHVAKKIGDLQNATRSKKVVKSRFTTDFPGTVTREGAGELSVRTHEEGGLRTFIDATNVGNKNGVPS